jgi:hypothetical protein
MGAVIQTQIRHETAGRVYYLRKIAEGKSHKKPSGL